MNHFDIIVAGGGHAGIEAAIAAAKMGVRTLLITPLLSQIGAISCNPAIGGLGKGHLVKEVDALGGVMGEIADLAALSYRTLNATKGAAVRGSRAQIDMDRYPIFARAYCLRQSGLILSQDMVVSLEMKGGEIAGVRTRLGVFLAARAVVLTTGTFLDAVVHIGEKKLPMGRMGEMPSIDLARHLRGLGFDMPRLKTGTCARITAGSIDFSRLERQESEESPRPISRRTPIDCFAPPNIPCFIAETNVVTHGIIRDNFHRAPLFTGQISGVGPRYCPSIEDKVNRFADRESHQIFVEPQSKEANEYYLNGLSTSLPIDVQAVMIRSIKGLKNAVISRYGYAIEYDFVQPTELSRSLESKKIAGLFLAGQINGTTGYEEAAAQGLYAGVNAALYIRDEEPFILGREEAYIGVLADDLVTKGTNEPYRMFTSRAEYRLSLREDNADLRLGSYAYRYGLIGEDEYRDITEKKEQIENGLKRLESGFLTNSAENLQRLSALGEEKIVEKTALINVVSRASFDEKKLVALDPFFACFSNAALEQILISTKYHHYLIKQEEQIERMKRQRSQMIPDDMEFEKIPGLGSEIVSKLNSFRPRTFFEAERISGMTPAALDILSVYIRFRNAQP
ncbi:MAG: tRNA uridine-5-carboxymethylaminomethyl(34) synthesis enzyme MnmG [Helicobacteraceae bacterium]|jgi:tRNA uridine 5-carboxymethylaminomethyl modification enzyme|nr:tRNA uridine-5-carboxymethylaminomethyl(34) synthesis enzyme MnmG [Helicobacteraceae bacterium]